MGRKGDLGFIINCDPMYKLIGGKEGQLSESLRETCEVEFNENNGSVCSCGSFERDYFMMKFHDLGNQAGLEEAVKIVNTIGFRTFGASFEKMEVPELLVAADAGDMMTNGKLAMAKTKEVIAQGGGASLRFRNLLRARLVG